MKDTTLVEIRPGVYQKAPTKIQIGFNKRIQRIAKSRVSDIERTLAIRGTLDVLAKEKFRTKWIMKEHPIDKGFFKRVLVLSDIGRKALDKLRQSRYNGTRKQTKGIYET